MNDNIAKPCAVHVVSICYVILNLSGDFFRYFQRFGVLFVLVFHSDLYFEKKGNEVLTRVIVFGRGESKSECILGFHQSCDQN